MPNYTHRPKSVRPGLRVTQDTVLSVQYLHAQGFDMAKIARKLGMAYETVRRIIKRRDNQGKPTGRFNHAPHRCTMFVPQCSECQMRKAFFLLVRARDAVTKTSPLLLHDIEDALLHWPQPLVAEDPVDRTADVDPDPGLGSEKEEKELLTA